MHVRLHLAAVAVAAVALAAAVASVAATHRDAAAGKIVFCADLGYPPMESLQGSRPIGADIDIGAALASELGTRAQFRNVGFDGIIAALLTKKCDAILSGMTDTVERRKQVDFADYLMVGMSLMVRKGNPEHVTGLASLSGRRVAAQVGTIEKDTLVAQNKLFAKQNRKLAVVKLFNKDSDAAAALVTGKVDAYFSDDPPVGYYVKHSGGKFELGAYNIQAAPYGIATRKGDPLGRALKGAVSRLYADGSMTSILSRWGLGAFALKG